MKDDPERASTPFLTPRDPESGDSQIQFSEPKLAPKSEIEDPDSEKVPDSSFVKQIDQFMNFKLTSTSSIESLIHEKYAK